MQIQVGINENLVVAETTKNDKGTLSIKVREAGEVSPLDALNSSGSTNFKPGEKDFLIYPPTVTAFSGEADTLEGILKKIAEVKDPLDHILRQYTTTGNIKWDIFAGTDITKENIGTKLLSQDVLDKVYSNIANQFIKMMQPFVGDNGKKLRWLFIRQSKAKHYPAMRKRFLETYPFVEPMDIPAAQSKLKFSKFEVDNGLTNGSQIGGSQTVSEEEKTSINELFTAN